MKKALFLSLIFLTGCYVPPIETTNSNGTGVSLILEHDGIKVYRFYDFARPVYFIDARGSCSWSAKEGKTDSHHESQTIR